MIWPERAFVVVSHPYPGLRIRLCKRASAKRKVCQDPARIGHYQSLTEPWPPRGRYEEPIPAQCVDLPDAATRPRHSMHRHSAISNDLPKDIRRVDPAGYEFALRANREQHEVVTSEPLVRSVPNGGDQQII